MAVQHLLEVSVCLLGVCLILCIAACQPHALKRHNQWNGLNQQSVSLDRSVFRTFLLRNPYRLFNLTLILHFIYRNP